MKRYFASSFLFHILIAIAFVVSLPHLATHKKHSYSPTRVIAVGVKIGKTTQGTGGLKSQTNESLKSELSRNTPNPVRENAPKQKIPERAKTSMVDPRQIASAVSAVGQKVMDIKSKPSSGKIEANTSSEQDFTSVLKNLAKQKQGAGEISSSGGSEFGNGEGEGGEGVADEAMISWMDAVSAQIAQCWNINSGSAEAQDLMIEIEVNLSNNYTVKSAKIVDQSRLRSDARFRAAAEGALRAVLNPDCNPLPSPPAGLYLEDRIIFNFNPKDMF